MSDEAAPGGNPQDWEAEKRALEERIRQLEALQRAAETQPRPAPPQPAPAPPQPHASLETARVPTAEEVQHMTDRLSGLIPESISDANKALLRHLTTIVRNLLRPPYTEPKFRRLPETNATLARELLSHPSARPVLCEVIGFETATEEDTGTRVLRLPASTPAHITELRAVQGALAKLEQRDDVAAEAARRFAQFRQGVAFELRMEKLHDAIFQVDGGSDDDGGNDGGHPSAGSPDADGQRNWACLSNSGSVVGPRLRTFLVSTLMWNDADTGTKVVHLLRRVGANVAKEPGNERVRTLRLSSAVVRDTLFPSKGSVEYLLAVLGFAWSDDGLALPLNANDPAAVAAYHARCAAGESLLDEAEAGLKQKRGAENELRRQAALREREEEKRLQAMEQQRLVARQNASAAASAAAAASDDGDDDGATKAGRRIPIAEALKHLMGN